MSDRLSLPVDVLEVGEGEPVVVPVKLDPESNLERHRDLFERSDRKNCDAEIRFWEGDQLRIDKLY